MADRSFCKIEIIAIPDGLAEKVAEAIRADVADVTVAELADLPFELLNPELVCGEGANLGRALAALSPDLEFEIQQSPKYEWNGDLAVQRPGLGLYEAECTDDGDPIITWEKVEKVLADNPPDPREALHRLFGRPWLQRPWQAFRILPSLTGKWPATNFPTLDQRDAAAQRLADEHGEQVITERWSPEHSQDYLNQGWGCDGVVEPYPKGATA